MHRLQTGWANGDTEVDLKHISQPGLMPGCCLPHPRATVDGVHPSLSISSTRQPIPFQPTLLMPPASSRAACYLQPHRPSRVALVPDLSYSERSDHRFRRRHHRLYTSTMGVYSRPLRLLYLSAHMLHVFTRVIASNSRWSVSCTRISRLYLNPAAHTLDLHTSSPFFLFTNVFVHSPIFPISTVVSCIYTHATYAGRHWSALLQRLIPGSLSRAFLASHSIAHLCPTFNFLYFIGLSLLSFISSVYLS